MKKFLIIIVVNFLVFTLLSCDSEKNLEEVSNSQNSGSQMPKGYVGSLYKAEPASESMKKPEFTQKESTSNLDEPILEQRNLEDYSGKPRFIEFWSPTCMTCLASKPVVYGLKEDFGEEIDFYSLSTSDYESRDAFMNYGIQAVPTFIIEDSTGKILFRSSGRANNKVFQSRFEEILNTN
jgi:thiol-disulfide isomerase/thioredoxin